MSLATRHRRPPRGETCPRCCGAGVEQHAGLVCGPEGVRIINETACCRGCAGSGRISELRSRQLAAGEKLRTARVSRREGLGHLARWLGVELPLLTAIEHGHQYDAAALRTARQRQNLGILVWAERLGLSVQEAAALERSE